AGITREGGGPFGVKGGGEPAAPRRAAEPAAPPTDAGPAAPPTGAEPAQPVFTRYWLHGKGPAPAGNLPVAVHLAPGRVTLDAPGGVAAPTGLCLTVACGPG